MGDTLESLEIEVKHSASGAADEIKSVTSAVRSLGRALEKVLPDMHIFRDLLSGKSMNITNNTTNQAAETINNVKEAASKASSATKEAAKGIDKVADSAKKTNKPVGNFLSSLKRIAFYRFIRTVIKELSQAFAEGLKNAYLFSSGLTTEGHRFAAAMDSMKSASTQMKNQLGSAFIALLTAIEPVVVAIVNLVIKLADAISQFISAFTGTTYLKAATVSDKFADDMASGAKSAKEWKNQLLGFDVINRLNEPSNGGGGGGLTPQDMFGGTDTPINEKFLKIVEGIKEFINGLDTGPLKEVVSAIRDDLKPILEKVGGICSWIWNNILAPLITWIVEKALPAIGGVVDAVLKVVNAIMERLGPVVDDLWQNVLRPIWQWIGDNIISLLNDLRGLLLGLADLISGKKSFKEFWDSLSGTQKWLGLVLAAVVLLSGIKGIAGLGKAFIAFATNPATQTIAIIMAIIVGGYLLIKNWDKIKEKLHELGERFKETWGNGKIEIEDFGYVAVKVLENIMTFVEKAIDGWKRLFEYINKGKQEGGFWVDGSKIGGTFVNNEGSSHAGGKATESLFTRTSGILSGMVEAARTANVVMPSRQNVSLPVWDDTYAAGGYPSTGQMFIARERGPELVGTIGNQTAVANNDQIVEAVSRGVANAVSAVLGRGGKGQEIHVYLDSREIKYGQSRLSRAMGV